MYYITILLYFRIAWITFWCFQLHILISYPWKICLPELYWLEILYGHGLLDRFNSSDECYARFRQIDFSFLFFSNNDECSSGVKDHNFTMFGGIGEMFDFKQPLSNNSACGK